MPRIRETFVVHVREDHAVLENVRTRERVRLQDLTEIGAQLESWLAEAELAPVPAPKPGP